MRRCIVIMMGLLLPLSLLAQHEWTVSSTAYDFNMTLVVEVQENGTVNPDLEIGAFCDMDCRGIAQPQYEAALGRYLWYLTVFGVSNDLIEFFIREEGIELEAKTEYNLLFQPNGIVGNPIEPQIIDFIVLNPTGCVTHEQPREIRICPMPVGRNQAMEVSLPSAEEELAGMLVEVYTLTGSLVQVKKPVCVPFALDPIKRAGTYLLKITMGTGEVLTEKIVVK